MTVKGVERDAHRKCAAGHAASAGGSAKRRENFALLRELMSLKAVNEARQEKSRRTTEVVELETKIRDEAGSSPSCERFLGSASADIFLRNGRPGLEASLPEELQEGFRAWSQRQGWASEGRSRRHAIGEEFDDDFSGASVLSIGVKMWKRRS